MMDDRIFLRFSARVGLTIHAVKSSINAKEPLFFINNSLHQVGVEEQVVLVIKENLGVGLLGTMMK